jgi:hypothetical protein
MPQRASWTIAFVAPSRDAVARAIPSEQSTCIAVSELPTQKSVGRRQYAPAPRFLCTAVSHLAAGSSPLDPKSGSICHARMRKATRYTSPSRRSTAKRVSS